MGEFSEIKDRLGFAPTNNHGEGLIRGEVLALERDNFFGLVRGERRAFLLMPSGTAPRTWLELWDGIGLDFEQ